MMSQYKKTLSKIPRLTETKTTPDRKKASAGLDNLAKQIIQQEQDLTQLIDEINKLELAVQTTRNFAVAQKEESEKFAHTIASLNAKLVQINPLVIDHYFPESKTIQRDLMALDTMMAEITLKTQKGVTETESAVADIEAQKPTAEKLLTTAKSLILSKIIKLGDTVRYYQLVKKDAKTPLSSLSNEMMGSITSVTKVLDSANTQLKRAKNLGGNAKKMMESCAILPICNQNLLKKLHYFCEDFLKYKALYETLVAELKKLTTAYQTKANSRCYKQAALRTVSISIIDTLINDQQKSVNGGLSLLAKDPMACLDNLLKAVKEQRDATQVDHKKGSFSFFTSSSLVDVYQKSLKVVPMDMQILSAHRINASARAVKAPK